MPNFCEPKREHVLACAKKSTKRSYFVYWQAFPYSGGEKEKVKEEDNKEKRSEGIKRRGRNRKYEKDRREREEEW